MRIGDWHQVAPCEVLDECKAFEDEGSPMTFPVTAILTIARIRT